VYRPVAEGGRYDLIFDVGTRLVRVQCKWAALRGDVLSVPFRSCRRGPDGFIRHTEIRLRVTPTRNNQRLRINWADDLDFAAKLKASGP
jgi:hypothetical protein